jgi:DNA-binding GntR family transcriptional regulator
MQESSRVSPPEIYRQLKEMILSFALYPGARVTETELAEHFGVSRTPVREALQRLAAEGYLSIRAKQGCFIRDIDIEEINQYYEVRIALEMRALELAGRVMSLRELNRLAAIWNPERMPRRAPAVATMVTRDEGFHLALAAGTGNAILAGYLKDVNDHIHIVRRLDFTDDGRIEPTYREHHEVLQRLLKQDVEGAKELLEQHIRRSADVAKAITLTQLASQRARAWKLP